MVSNGRHPYVTGSNLAGRIFFIIWAPKTSGHFFYAGGPGKRFLPFNLRMTTFFKGSMKAAIRQARAT